MVQEIPNITPLFLLAIVMICLGIGFVVGWVSGYEFRNKP